MPTTRVGGINIGIGTDIHRLIRGLNVGKTQLKDFQKKMTKIRLEGAIKGDPFSSTRKYMKTAQKQLDTIFSAWSENIQYATSNMNKYAQTSNRVTERIVKNYEKISKKMGALQKAGKTNITFSGMGLEKGAAYAGSLGSEKFHKRLEGLRGFSTQVDKIINKIEKNLATGKQITARQMNGYFSVIRQAIQRESGPIISQYQKFGQQLKAAMKAQEKLQFQSRLEEAGSREAALRRIKKATQDLRVEETKLRRELSLNYNVEQNRRALLENLQAQKAAGAKLTRKQTAELHNLTRQVKKYDAASRKAKGGDFLSPEWFKVRAKWFAELRLLWGTYQAIGDAARSLAEAHRELARAMRTANSEFMDAETIRERYLNAMRTAFVEHGADWKESGEVLYQLTSAGLSSEEALAGLAPAMQLIIGLEGDARETTKTLAGIYNNFADTITKVTGRQEKLQYIADLTAAVWRRNQIEISEYQDALRQGAAAARIAGLNLDELTAIVGELHNMLIKGGTAGRSFQNVLMRISREPKKFEEEFGVMVDPNKPLNFFNVMDAISEKYTKRFKEGKAVVADIAGIFDRMGIRGAKTFTVMVEKWEDIRDALEEYQDNHGEAAEIEQIALNNIISQWERFKGGMLVFVTRVIPLMDKATAAMKYWADAMEKFAKTQESLQDIEIGIVELRPLLFTNTELTPEEKSNIKKLLQNVTDQIVRLQAKKDWSDQHPELEGTVFKWITPEELSELEYLNTLYDQIINRLYKAEEVYVDSWKKKKEVINEELDLTKDTERRIYIETSLRKKARQQAIKELKKFIADQNELIRSDMTALSGLSRETQMPQRTALIEAILEKIKDRKKLEQDLNKLVREQEAAERELQRLEKERLKKINEEYNVRIAINGVESDQLKTNKEMLEEKGVTADEYSKILQNIEDQYKVTKDLALLEYSQAIMAADLTEAQKKLLAIELKKKLTLADQKKLQSTIELNTDRIHTKEREITLAIAKKLNTVEKEKFELQKQDAAKVELLKKDRQLVSLELQKYQLNLDNNLPEIDRLRLLSKIRNKKLEILKIDEDIRRENSFLYDIQRRLEEKTKTWKETTHDLAEQFSTGFAGGMADIMTDITGGFQDAQEEAKKLESELAGLQEEAADLREKGILTEDEIDQLREINEESAKLEDQINDLQDPIQNVKEAFKDLFKSLIDDIRHAINQWIAMQVVTGLLSSFGGGAATSGFSAPAGVAQGIGPGGFLVPAGATGGVFPSMKPFRSFAQGGITSGPMLMVGDNRSGRELVIPEENIKANNVSGYMQESDSKPNITIVNVVTPEDIARAMAGGEGETVILNHLGKALENNNSITRRLGG